MRIEHSFDIYAKLYISFFFYVLVTCSVLWCVVYVNLRCGKLSAHLSVCPSLCEHVSSPITLVLYQMIRNTYCLWLPNFQGHVAKLMVTQAKTRQIWGSWKLRPAYSPEMPNLGQNRWSFVPCDLEIWLMTLENNRASLICCFKLCATFHSHLVNSNWSYSPETTNLGQIQRFFSRVTLKFDVWPYKTIGHLFYATSSFVHHFVAIGELKLELQSGNAQFGSNSTIFRAVWPWNLTDDLEKL